MSNHILQGFLWDDSETFSRVGEFLSPHGEGEQPESKSNEISQTTMRGENQSQHFEFPSTEQTTRN